MLQPLSIAVVEDDASLGYALARHLETDGHAVRRFEDPRDARSWLLRGPTVDVVVTDHSMPGMTGPELCAEIRARRESLAPPFVLMVGDPARPMSARDRTLFASIVPKVSLGRGAERLIREALEAISQTQCPAWQLERPERERAVRPVEQWIVRDAEDRIVLVGTIAPGADLAAIAAQVLERRAIGTTLAVLDGLGQAIQRWSRLEQGVASSWRHPLLDARARSFDELGRE